MEFICIIWSRSARCRSYFRRFAQHSGTLVYLCDKPHFSEIFPSGSQPEIISALALPPGASNQYDAVFWSVASCDPRKVASGCQTRLWLCWARRSSRPSLTWHGGSTRGWPATAGHISLLLRLLICFSPVLCSCQFNFVGKILGPQGNTIKRLQEETGAKISVLGKGSMRDKSKVIFAHANIWCCTPVRRIPEAIKHLACARGEL